MVNYSNGKIYKLWSDESDMFYIGSTTQQLCRRLAAHNQDIKNGRTKTHIEMREHSNIKIELVKLFPCNSKEELSAEEGRYIRMWKDEILNKRIEGRTVQEYRQENPEKIAEIYRIYYESNKNTLNKKTKAYYDENRDEILEQKKVYADNNKQHIKEYQKSYYESNKNTLNEKTKAYYEDNRDKILEQKKVYGDNNKKTIKEKTKIYREKNRDKIRLYKETHREKINERRRELRAAKKNIPNP